MLALTGATGYIGRALVKRLQRDGMAFVSLGRSDPGSGVPHRQLDLDDHRDFGGALVGVTTLVHCAGIAHRNAAAEDYARVNLAATLSLAQAAVACGVRRFVYLSSLNVVPADSPAADMAAGDMPQPDDPYGASKWQAERQLEEQLAGTRCQLILLRPALVFDVELIASLAQLERLLRWLPCRLPAIGCRAMIARSDLIGVIRGLLDSTTESNAVIRLPLTDGCCYTLSDIGSVLIRGRQFTVYLPRILLRCVSFARDLHRGVPLGATWRSLVVRRWCRSEVPPGGDISRLDFITCMGGNLDAQND